MCTCGNNDSGGQKLHIDNDRSSRRLIERAEVGGCRFLKKLQRGSLKEDSQSKNLQPPPREYPPCCRPHTAYDPPYDFRTPRQRCLKASATPLDQSTTTTSELDKVVLSPGTTASSSLGLRSRRTTLWSSNVHCSPSRHGGTLRAPVSMGCQVINL